jgi:uncharacterized protein (DUF433 family)
MEEVKIIDRGRGPELSTIRITVYDIIPYMQRGYSPAGIADAFGISLAQVEALLRYIEEHKEEVMEENRKIEERIARGNPPEIEEKRKQSHARMLALREELLRRRSREQSNEGNPG